MKPYCKDWLNVPVLGDPRNPYLSYSLNGHCNVLKILGNSVACTKDGVFKFMEYIENFNEFEFYCASWILPLASMTSDAETLWTGHLNQTNIKCDVTMQPKLVDETNQD